jgi:hypothetical protein
MFVVDYLKIIIPIAVMLSLIMLNDVVQSYVSRFNVKVSFTLLSQQTLTALFCHFLFFSKTLTGIRWYKKLQRYSANYSAF